LVRLERQAPPTTAAEREQQLRENEFRELHSWMFAQGCISATELIAKGLAVPSRFTRVFLEDLRDAERMSIAFPLACELRNEDKDYFNASWAARLFGELELLGVSEEQARSMAGQFEFRWDGNEPS
jgi:hypothetical protein